MNKVILYIKDTYGDYQKVDLFDDETISVTSKIQDIRDISKVFTDFSQSFTLPASKTNNKIFAHFYNYFIDGQIQSDGSEVGVFDARKKKDAIIEINYIPFRSGKIFLNGVKMKDNKPYSYNITFFGNTVTLTDLFGDDELSQLDLSAFDHDYGVSEVQTGLTTGLFSESIIYPLITHTQRLYYDSRNPEGHNSNTLDGNLFYHNNQHSEDVALRFTELKPALKIKDIINAIESKYEIEFVDSDFISTTPMSNLYMWLSRRKGAIGASQEDGERVKVLEDWQHDSGDTYVTISSNGQELSVVNKAADLEIATGATEASAGYYLTITPESLYTSTQYDVEIYVDGVLKTTKNNVTGTQNLNYIEFFSLYTNLLGHPNKINNKVVKFIVKSEQAFLFTPSVTFRSVNVDNPKEEVLNCNGVLSATSTILISQEIPKMKVIDFVSGILKTFNLTLYYISDESDADYGKIKMIPLDDFFDDNPQTFDITEYVDSSQHDVDSTIPFSEVDFEYQEPKTLLMKQHEEIFNHIFGDEEFKPEGVDRGKPYTVKLPFEHLKYERLFDVNGDVKKDILWGYSAGDNFKPDPQATPQPTANYEPTLTKPVIFYGIRETGLTDGVNFNTGTTNDELYNYWRPSNTNEDGSNQDEPFESGLVDPVSTNKLIDGSKSFLSNVEIGDFVVNSSTDALAAVLAVDSDTQLTLSDDIFTISYQSYGIFRPPQYTLNFDNEIDEWNLTDYEATTNSLFKVFYKTYIEDAFNPKKRIFKLTAYLPNSILLNYKLNDRFQISDKVFTINSIDTNLKTGESKLELLNVL
jgi:hypothetical protein